MATPDVTHISCIDKDARKQSFSLFFHTLESLPEVSGALAAGAAEGESYEVLVRRIRVLHANIVELAEHGKYLYRHTR